MFITKTFIFKVRRINIFLYFSLKYKYTVVSVWPVMSGSGVLDGVEDGGLLGIRLNGDLRPVAGRNFYNKPIN